MRKTKYYHHPKRSRAHKSKKKSYFLIFILVFIPLFVLFVPGPNGLIKVLSKSYRRHQLKKEIEYYKIKAELLESKIAKTHNLDYVKKYLMDYYKMVPKESVK
ncbi:MAG: hypothetical protein ABIK61_03740 [candidate division WOR-3 bacterium]